MGSIQTANWQACISDPKVVVEDANDIAQCIYTILATVKGSDPLRPDFGSDLYKFIDQPINLVQPQMIFEVFNALEKWEPRIVVNRVRISTDFDRKIIHIDCGVIRSSRFVERDTPTIFDPIPEEPEIPEPPEPLEGDFIVIPKNLNFVAKGEMKQVLVITEFSWVAS